MAATGNFFPWEVGLMEWLQAHISGAELSIVSLFSMFGEELTLILIVGFVYWSYDKRLGRTMGLSGIMGLAFNTMAKNTALRRRPYFDHEDIRILRVVEPEADICDIAATVFGALAVSLRRRWATVIAIAISLLTGISRFVIPRTCWTAGCWARSAC